jgi:hypothetical protein
MKEVSLTEQEVEFLKDLLGWSFETFSNTSKVISQQIISKLEK